MIIPADFLKPQSIAVVGASTNRHKLGGRLLHALKFRGFPGPVYPINERQSMVQDLPAFARLSDVPAPIDLALIIVPAEDVEAVLDDCAAAGIKNAVIFSSGFAEAPDETGLSEDPIAALADRHGMAVLGPNAEGFLSFDPPVAATFSPTVLYEGDPQIAVDGLGIIAQSGGVGFAIFNRARQNRLGTACVITTGNEAGLGSIDFLRHLIDTPEVRLIVMFIEACRGGRRLPALAARAARLGKPIIVAKAGRSDAGRRAARSHTASLAGSGAIFDAVARHAGLLLSDDPDDIVNIAAGLASGPLPAGRRVAVLTTSGGSGVWLADVLAARGLELPALEDRFAAAYRPRLPHYASLSNPIDVTGQAARDPVFFDIIDDLNAGDHIDIIVVAAPLAAQTFIDFAARYLQNLQRRRRKPILFFAYSLPDRACIDRLAEVGIYCFTSLRGIALAAAALADFSDTKKRAKRLPTTGTRQVQPTDLSDVRCEYQLLDLLRSIDLPAAAGALVKSAEQAADRARTLGFPVALKIQSPEIAHKSEIGGVCLNLTDEYAVQAAYHRICTAVQSAAPAASCHGALVQSMAPAGIEMFIGALVDRDFGPMIAVGFGGLGVETCKDHAFAAAPLDRQAAQDLVESLDGIAKLRSAGDRPAADIEALAGLLCRISELAAACEDQFVEIDLNPVIVHPAGTGITIVDAWLVPADGR